MRYWQRVVHGQPPHNMHRISTRCHHYHFHFRVPQAHADPPQFDRLRRASAGSPRNRGPSRAGKLGRPATTAALDHAGRGFHIFPLHPGSKVPAIKHWEDAATRDLDRIQRWWRRWPADNIAVACGPSGLHVLDLDTSHDQPPPPPWDHARDGRDALAQLAAEVFCTCQLGHLSIYLARAKRASSRRVKLLQREPNRVRAVAR
ncbi:bifunctional DNA primase/polymerase [Nocardia sp. NBC_00403]|uniref:bifunctional DNA primase/polymerase n=1 Tax=Nocardia sp. NBC_00403 TaxID=2975990 RepID=UPI003FA5DB11